MLLLGSGACEARTDGEQPQPQSEAMEKTYSADDVKAARTRTGFDAQAMRLDGVVGVGTAGNSPDDSWISVLCTDEAALDSARQALGTTLEGIPIRYRTTGVIRAQ